MSSTGYSKTQSAAKTTTKQPESDARSEGSLDVKNIWQHPFVDVFKHFKLAPTQDWKLNKKQGDVTETFVSAFVTSIQIIALAVAIDLQYLQLRPRKSVVKLFYLTETSQQTTIY